MKYKKQIFFILCLTIFSTQKITIFAGYPAVDVHNTILHPSYPTYNDYKETANTDPDIQPIPFTPAALSTTDTDNFGKVLIGYYWNSKDSDNSLLYPGKARIGNDQFINVVAVDSKSVSTSSYDPSLIVDTGATNVYAPKDTKMFDPGALVKLGTFMKKNDPVVYSVYGEYLSTIIPDPETVEFTNESDPVPVEIT